MLGHALLGLDVPSGPQIGSFSLFSLVIGLIAALAVMLVIFGLIGERGAGDEVARRLERYSEFGERGAAAESGPKQRRTPRELLDSLTDSLNQVMARSSRTGRLAESLARADLRLKSSEWVLGVAGAGVVLGLLLWLRFANPVFLLVGPPAMWMGSGIALKVLQSRRTRAFDKQLGATLTLLSNALKAGYSFAQAVNTVAKSASPPIAEEFARATREMALGISVDDALNHMVKRNMSEDFDLMVTAVQIHRVVGGNLAEILDTIAHTIRERVRIKGEIRTLTAQARASGWIITMLPIGLALVLSVISPDYFNPMFTHTIGVVMLAIGGFSMLIGFAIIQKIVKIEV
jgi:tight adherence protein B